ncbi:MAG TPA: O-methyltransferase [Chitinophagaceae bacterium]|nr:O-methyltransferase [Chitinophagaceae bacterium]
MEIVNSLAQQYAEKYTTIEDELIKEVADYTIANHQMSQMLSGHLQGKLLEMISCMIRPTKILEIGTFTGYSALCLAKGLTEDGVLHTIELREEEAAIAQKFFDRSFQREKIVLHVGDALQIIDELEETWDLVFIDADKPGYINYFNRVLLKVRRNGFILADNVLFHGEVLTNPVSGKNAIAIQAFNDFVNGRSDVEKLMLPLRDGIYLIKKIA